MSDESIQNGQEEEAKVDTEAEVPGPRDVETNEDKRDQKDAA